MAEAPLRGCDGQVKQGEQEILHARDSVGQNSGATQWCPRPRFSDRIRNSRPTGGHRLTTPEAVDVAPGVRRSEPQVLGWYRRAQATKRGGMGGEESECGLPDRKVPDRREQNGQNVISWLSTRTHGRRRGLRRGNRFLPPYLGSGGARRAGTDSPATSRIQTAGAAHVLLISVRRRRSGHVRPTRARRPPRPTRKG